LRSHDDLVALARASEKPVINGLTDRSHPCQVLADLLTLEEVAGSLAAQRVVYIGDGNNMATSLIEASALTGFALTVVSPAGYEPPSAVIERARSIDSGTHTVTLTNEITHLDNATAIYTDVWTSMGQERDQESRRRAFMHYQVNQAVMDRAPGAIFMHCLPAHRGEEVTDEVIDGPRSVVFQQAENRLYAQMALMAELFT
jgi:ornithine carbamoyltransferase